jgi:hypothetical protein
MNRARLFLSLALAAHVLWAGTPLEATAQTLMPIPHAYGVAEIQAALARNGYEVDAPTSWSTATTWTTLTSFRAMDDRTASSASQHTFMVLVFPDVASADRHRGLATTLDPAATAERGPRLVDGYGPSIWLSNVAVAESLGDSVMIDIDTEFLASLLNSDLGHPESVSE